MNPRDLQNVAINRDPNIDPRVGQSSGLAAGNLRPKEPGLAVDTRGALDRMSSLLDDLEQGLATIDRCLFPERPSEVGQALPHSADLSTISGLVREIHGQCDRMVTLRERMSALIERI